MSDLALIGNMPAVPGQEKLGTHETGECDVLSVPASIPWKKLVLDVERGQFVELCGRRKDADIAHESKEPGSLRLRSAAEFNNHAR